MLTVKEFLTASGLEVAHDRIKLVRHVSHTNRTLAEMVDAGEFEFYQAEQRAENPPFENCDVLVSFHSSEDGGCTFYGVYRVGGSRPLSARDMRSAPAFLKELIDDVSARVIYSLKEDHGFNELRGRLRVKWKAARSWVQGKDLRSHRDPPAGKGQVFSRISKRDSHLEGA